MKTKLFLFILSGMVLISCTKKADEPTPPEPEPQPQPEQVDTIGQDMLLSYFPYKTADRIVYYNDLIGNINYTVVESRFTKEDSVMHVSVMMWGVDMIDPELFYVIKIEAQVTNRQVLQVDFTYTLDTGSEETAEWNVARGSYTYDAASKEKLPASITLSNGSIIKQNEGLIYFVDYDAEKWYFNKRL